MSTIPISQISSVTPSVLSAGGAASRLSGVVLTQDDSVPAGQLLEFYSADDVSDYFGATSTLAAMATAYFAGIVNGGQLPYEYLVGRFAEDATPAGVYGASLGLTLAELQALSGKLAVTTSQPYTSDTINLSGVTTFAAAASAMTDAFTGADFTITYDATRKRFVLETAVTGSTAFSSDVSGTLAAGVGLSADVGAYTQAQGVDVDTAATAMDRVVNQSDNWGTFTMDWLPSIDDRKAFAAWNSAQNYQYAYIEWDTDAASTVSDNPSSFGQLAFNTPYQGVLPLYGPAPLAAASQSYAASINFDVAEGRTAAAFRQFNAGLDATCSTLKTAKALISNNYTYLGAYANQDNNYTILYPGAISGQFLWTDTYLNQIYFNRELARAGFEAMLAYNSLPYNSDGYTRLYRAYADVCTAALTSGIIRAGVTLAQTQAQQIDTKAGRSVSPVVSTRGWYLLIQDAANAAQARQNRTSPTVILWYCDGGSIQEVNLSSIAVI